MSSFPVMAFVRERDPRPVSWMMVDPFSTNKPGVGVRDVTQKWWASRICPSRAKHINRTKELAGVSLS